MSDANAEPLLEETRARAADPRIAVAARAAHASALAELEERTAQHRRICTLVLCSDCGRVRCFECGAPCQADARGPFDICQGCSFAEGAEKMGIPTLHRGVSFGAVDVLRRRIRRHDAVIEAMRSSVTATAVVLIGPAGAGKSTALAAMLRARFALDFALTPTCRPPFWCSAIAIGNARAEHRLGQPTPDVIRAALRAPLLALDDLGAEPAHQNPALAEVIYGRHDAGKPTWISTGLSARDVGARYGGGLERRVFERATVLELGGVASR